MAQDARLRRRMLGLIKARLPDLQLDSVDDPRSRRGRRWQLAALLGIALVGMLTGCQSLLDVEQLSCMMSEAARRLLGISRCVPDTTMRTVLCVLLPDAIRSLLHRQVRAAYRRKALQPTQLPMGVVAVDGKTTTLPSCDDNFAQRQTAEGGALVGALRTMTCCLISAAALPCLDAIPIPAETNEMATFALCLSELIRVYGGLDLFRMVAADAGSCSLENASLVRSHMLHYLFALKSTQPTLYNEASRLLGALDVSQALASSEDHLGGERVVIRRLYLCTEMTGFHDWEHLRTVLRVSSQTFEHGTLTKDENRYFVCSLSSDRLSSEQWLKLVRQYWMVENGPHWTLDVPLQEDAHPWIESEPQGALVLALLRRVAYNMLSLFRAVTLRAEDNRATPWKSLLVRFKVALYAALDSDLVELRVRIPGHAAATSSQPVLG